MLHQRVGMGHDEVRVSNGGCSKTSTSVELILILSVSMMRPISGIEGPLNPASASTL